jgi:hypothetical protein
MKVSTCRGVPHERLIVYNENCGWCRQARVRGKTRSGGDDFRAAVIIKLPIGRCLHNRGHALLDCQNVGLSTVYPRRAS